ncbi:MAG: glutamine--fructose-6-phosphate transaminase (isomerizing) [Gammaproteobacteria bacterium]|nr:glutamine--fructose-6-phosphate transaminase (isomerizing) [Gammaproteobacteria bacterium]
MCGIVGAVAQRNVVPILIEGLKRLEYRGYDSAGIAVLGNSGQAHLERVRAVGKVKALEDSIRKLNTDGQTGIAHTRWATHGVPSEDNAHPHVSHGVIAVVHNGIIENHEKLRKKLQELGYEFTSQTDTEVVAHLVHHHLKKQKDLCQAAMAAIGELEGAYALGIISRDEPDRLIAARKGSPLVVGVGIGEHFIGSDVLALAPVPHNVIYLEDGDVADLRRTGYIIYDAAGKKVERPVRVSEASADAVDRGQYRNFTEKEIFEQPKAVADTLAGRLGKHRILEEAFGVTAGQIFDNTKGLPCNVEIASEYRYRKHVVLPGTLVVTISQSGETADTLAALQQTKKLGYGHSLAICNVPESSLVRESELTLLTRAGPEIGVASTKAFVTQLTALLLLTIALARRHGLTAEKEKQLVEELEQLPGRIQKVLELSDEIRQLSERFVDKQHALFLGRGVHYPIAMEGALKLKEISYIHAESYAAGELKHGPLALVDANMPVIAVAPNDELLEKLKSNLQEVRARGGELFVFSEKGTGVRASNTTKIRMPEVGETTSPILYTVPLQLLAYYVALAKGTDVDQPRNLAKSVTVE